jgi:hypothetical protein
MNSKHAFCTTIPHDLTILAGDILCTRARELLTIIGPIGDLESAAALKDAICVYTEVRLDNALRESVDILLQHVDSKLADEKSPDALRCTTPIESELD